MKFRFSVRTSVLGLILLIMVIFILFVSPKMQTHAATKAELVDKHKQIEMVVSDVNGSKTALVEQETTEKQIPVLYLRIISELVKTFYIA